MANQKDQKRKLLAIQRIFLEKTDPSHPLTLAQITEELAALDIDAERKSIYACIDALREAGMDIQMKRDPYPAYYVDRRHFTPGEMTLLVDIVRSCPSITNANAAMLTKKIMGLASEGQLTGLKGRIDVPERDHRRSKYLLFNVRRIQEAIRRKKQVGFRYMTYDLAGEFKFHTERRQRVLVHFCSYGHEASEPYPPKHGDNYGIYTPVRIVFMAGYYYLVCWDEHAEWANGEGDFHIFRIDRMSKVFTAEERPAVRNERIANYRPEDWEDADFGMFYNQKGKQTITLSINDEGARDGGNSWIMTAFRDKFGDKMHITVLDDTTARVRVHTVASPQFFSWLLQFGGAVKIEKPSKVAQQYVDDYLKPALERYE